MSQRQNSYFLLSLGCSKNTVDSHSIAALLDEAGLRGTDAADRAEVLIVNTCGFIDSAREESIAALRELAARKQDDQYLIAAGCLAQRYGHDLPAQVPQLDGVIGTRRWMDIVELVKRLRARKHPEPIYHLPDEAVTVGSDERGVHPGLSEAELRSLFADCAADLVCVGHTHWPMDVRVGAVRVVNLGSVSNPLPPDLRATYIMLEANDSGYRLQHRWVDYDHQAVIAAAYQVRHPVAGYIARYMIGQRQASWMDRTADRQD